MAKASQKDFLNTVSGIAGTWRDVEGGGVSAEYNRDYDGGSDRSDILTGPPEHEDLTLTRTFDPIKDDAWVRKLYAMVGRSRHTLTRQPIDPNKTKIGKPMVYPNAVLVGMTYPGSSNSADPADIVMVFAHNGPAK